MANPTNQRILTILAVEPSYARRIAGLLGGAESDVSRRLRALEQVGLLESSWARAGGNVKMYALAADRLDLRFTPAGPTLTPAGSSPKATPAPPAQVALPATEGFVGRKHLLERLEEAPPVVLLQGLPGIGKTSLLVRHTQDADPLWITCRGAESLTWVANLAALHLAGRGRPDLLKVLEDHPPAARLADHLLEALDHAGMTTVLDDVHAIGDADLRGFLGDAVERFQDGRLLLAGRGYIPHARQAGVLEIHLEGLGDPEVSAFLESKGFQVTDGLLQRVREEVGGHPLALHLLTEAAAGAGGLEPLLDRRPERELTDYLLEEIDAGLTEAQRTALSQASLFAHVFHRQELEALCGQSLEGPLLALRRRHLVAGSEDGMRLHEVVHNFYYGRLQDRARLHRRAAQVCLERSSTDGHLEALHHLLAAGERDEVLKLLKEDLDLHDYHFVDSGYHRLYDGILSMVRREEVDGPDRWAQIQDERGDLAYHRREWTAALRRYEEASDGFDACDERERWGDTVWKRALCLRELGDDGKAEELCRDALEHLPEGSSRIRIERLLAQEAVDEGAITEP